MKLKLLAIVFALATAAQGAVFGGDLSYPPELKPAQHEAKAASVAAELLSRYHYKAKSLDEAPFGEDF